MSKRYFINNLDTRVGRALLGQLVKEPVEESVHMCTMRNQNVQKPNGIKKILKRAKPKLSKKKMLEECDVYVYSLENTDVSDIKFALSALEKGTEEQKVLVLISDVRVWSDSGRKRVLRNPKQQNNQEGEEEEKQNQGQNVEKDKQQSFQAEKEPTQKSQSEQPKEEQEGDGEEQEGKSEEEEDPYIYVQFQEEDYEHRKPLPQYEYIKETEDLVLHFRKENLKVIVICPGILYGQGEQIFESLFKAAWLQEPKALPYLGQGGNLLPTIHIADLAKFIIKLAEAPPEQKIYFHAFDLTKDRRQKAIIESIATGVGSGLVESVQSSPIITDPDTFRLDLQVLPSKLLVGTEQESVDFQWTAKHGLNQCIKNVLQEFCQYHNLRPLKIITYVNQQDRKQSNYDRIIADLQKEYRIPILRSKQILKYALQNLEGQLKQALQDQYQAIIQYLDEGKPRQLDETLKVYYRVMKWRLSQNDCATRGFILDGQPRFEEQFKYVFLPVKASKLKRKVKKPQPVKPKEQKAEQEEGDNEEKKQQQAPQQQQQEQQQPQEQNDEEKPKKEAFYPQSIIVIKNLNIHKHHKNEVVEYLSQNGVEELLYDSIEKSRLVVSQSLRSYIERNGRPNNYLISKDTLIEEHETYYKNLNDSIKQQKEEAQDKNQSVKDSQRAHRQSIAAQVFKMIQSEGQFQIKKMPFRNYLMQFVVPTLNESLLQVSNIIPNDPVELLAEYLYQKSYQS